MSRDIVGIIKGIVKDELKRFRTTELGVVTALYSHESGGGKNNYQCNVKLKDSGLELQRVNIATQRIGAVAIPNVNDLVMVHFVRGDIHSAVVTGRVYNDADRPPVAKPHELVYISPDSKESGIRRIYLEFPNGNKLLINDDEITLEAGKTKITFKNDGDVVLESNAKLNIKTKGDTTISAKGKISLEASGDMDLSATNISIKGKANASLEGAASTVKGATVDLKGMTSFSPS
jgi:uncharacterized protein involved in type VI secretion and phage assembly